MNIYTLDLLHRNTPETIGAYLLDAPAGPILIETGPMSTLPTMLAELDKHGLKPDDIKHVLVTHIHFDHAGATGWWAQQGAQLYVHKVGAPHLIDPRRLLKSAKRIYKDDMERLWGSILPAPVSQVTHMHHQETVEIAGLEVTPLDTPGHAWHHHVYRIGNVGFTGDALGIRISQSRFLALPAPPPEFKLNPWLNSIDIISQQNFEAVYLTHFGRVDDVSQHIAKFRQILLDSTSFIKDGFEKGLTRDELVETYVAYKYEIMTGLGMTSYEFKQFDIANPLYMSVDGILRYWKREAEKKNA